jgi:hypothetical protein
MVVLGKMIVVQLKQPPGSVAKADHSGDLSPAGLPGKEAGNEND